MYLMEMDISLLQMKIQALYCQFILPKNIT